MGHNVRARCKKVQLGSAGCICTQCFRTEISFSNIDTMLQCPKVIQNVLINEKLNISPFLHILAIQLHLFYELWKSGGYEY